MTTSPPMDDSQLRKLLEEVRTIAVVGLSAEPSKDSYRVASYLKQHGYRIIPVNPRAEEILDEKAYPDLKSIPEPIDVVDVFRRPEFLPEVAEEAVRVRAKVLWMQLGIRNEEAAQIAATAGMNVVQDACILQEHARLIGR
jgi:uncharacterized protein